MEYAPLSHYHGGYGAATRLCGRVKIFDCERGWGFIATDDPSIGDLFVHKNVINAGWGNDSWLNVGEYVECGCAWDSVRDRWNATEVRGSGIPLQCVMYPTQRQKGTSKHRGKARGGSKKSSGKGGGGKGSAGTVKTSDRTQESNVSTHRCQACGSSNNVEAKPNFFGEPCEEAGGQYSNRRKSCESASDDGAHLKASDCTDLRCHNESLKEKLGTPTLNSNVDSSEPENAVRSHDYISRRKEVFDEANVALLESAVDTILRCLGENPARSSLMRTPKRVAQSLLTMTSGYDMNLHTIVNDALFNEDHVGMVLVRDIEIFSLCEHHMLPFYGKIHIAYTPDGKVIGLSKLGRIAQMFARRLQVQERLTVQVADAISEILQPRGIAVYCEAKHGCMIYRGLQSSAATTITSCFRGEFQSNEMLRQEFLQSIQTASAS